MAAQPSPRRYQFRLGTWFVASTILAVQCAVCFPALKEWQRQRELDPHVNNVLAIARANYVGVLGRWLAPYPGNRAAPKLPRT
jgi:hypothetical protein